jgi:hypothetical protein
MSETLLTIAPAPSRAVQGYELWRGPARYSRDQIVVIATGYGRPSTNEKTGAMIQTYILVSDVDPVEAVRTGADGSICGAGDHACSFRPAIAGPNDSAACYVNKGHGPLAVWRAWTRDRYPILEPAEAGARAAALGRPIRIGTYGDPAMVPVAVWRALLQGAGSSGRHTGYTHQWRRAPFLRGLCMASVDNPRERDEARALGWRTFRVGDEILAGEINCPASAEAGKRTTCEHCKLCNGSRGAGDRRADIAIRAHGGAIALELARAGRAVPTIETRES